MFIFDHICLYLYCRVLLVFLCSYVTNRDHIPIRLPPPPELFIQGLHFGRGGLAPGPMGKLSSGYVNIAIENGFIVDFPMKNCDFQ